MLDDISLNVPAATPLSRSLSKSTPRDPTLKLHPPPKSQAICRAEDDISVQPHSQVEDQSVWSGEDTASNRITNIPPPRSHLINLEAMPAEILELIAGYVVGHLGSANGGSTDSEVCIKNWNEIMRHPRRRNISDLALTSRTWRRLIQERLFRHIKVQGTVEAQEQCSDFFLTHPHLQRYVRHLQVIVPIWEMKRKSASSSATPETSVTRGILTQMYHAILPSNAGEGNTLPTVETSQIFQLASQNATIDEIFITAKILFPELCALTIEAGHCKRPPQIKFFRDKCRQRSLTPCPPGSFPLPSVPSSSTKDTPVELQKLPSVKTLILKGAWNIIRTPGDFLLLSKAMPNLQEFHCNYHALKTDAYIAMCLTLRKDLSSTITHLNISLDGLYTKHIASLQKWRKVYPGWHICLDLGRAIPQLETLTFTGRACQHLFTSAIQAMRAKEFSTSTNSRLKSIDLIVNNVCCDPWLHNDATGIQHYPFIEAFENLILAAIRALNVFLSLNKLRIRFIDLDSPAPLLNPMFHLEKTRAWGFWSEEIVMQLRAARPRVRFLGLRGQMGPLLECEDQEESKRSLSVEYYRAMAHGGVLIH